MADKQVTYVALLRGINVGGKNRVEMARLKALFERNGFRDVKTYINSGNVIFREKATPEAALAKDIEKAIYGEFGFHVSVLVRSEKSMKTICSALPQTWKNDQSMKCDVMFLWNSVDKSNLVQQLKIEPKFEDLKYAQGALIWRIDREYITRSAMLKIVGTPLYKQMTIRNCNTVRKIAALMSEIALD